jgi:hypothetical protein
MWREKLMVVPVSETDQAGRRQVWERRVKSLDPGKVGLD